MKKAGLTSIAVMALVGQVDKAKAIEMNANQKENAHVDHAAVTSPVNDQKLNDQKSKNGKNKTKKADKTSSTNNSKKDNTPTTNNQTKNKKDDPPPQSGNPVSDAVIDGLKGVSGNKDSDKKSFT